MPLDRPIPLRSSRPYRRHRSGGSGGNAALIVLALGIANYALFFSDGPGVEPPSLGERLQTPTPAVVPAPANLDPASAPTRTGTPGERRSPRPLIDEGIPVDDFGDPIGRKVAGKLRRGRTILKALGDEGIDSHTALPLVQAMERVFDFRTAQVGDRFEAWLDDEGQVRRFRYEQNPLEVYEVTASLGNAYAARKIPVPTRVELAHLGCAIKSSLYESMSRCGEEHRLGSQFIDLFAWDVDFFTDVRQNDAFRVLVEKISVDGQFLKYGRILAAEYNGKFGRHRMVYYTDAEGVSGYFTPDGRAVHRTFLKSPLKYTRMSAASQAELRAVGGSMPSVAYYAETGTPVWAVAGGTVVHAGPNGERRGISVTIKHDNGFTSTYSHLDRITRKLETGMVVSQKTVIGYVGQSGQAAEPKLRFSVRKNGRLLDPRRLATTDGDPISTDHEKHFRSVVDERLEALDETQVIGIHDRRS
jgi:murein DD-endopeptidase MepM/ murein hydrolase activator NlpD